MPVLWELDKVLKQGISYQSAERVGYLIKKLGTNSSGLARLKIEEVELGYIDSDCAPLRLTSSNKLGPLDLEELTYIIPPKTKFSFEGDSGSLCRIIGEIVQVSPGEAFPGDLMTRFAAQAKKYKTLYTATLSLGTDVTWKDNIEYEVFSITPLTTEKVLFDSILMCSITGNSVSEGDFGIEFYFNNVPLELDVATNLMRGIDSLACPLPPTETKGEIAFSLKQMPVEVPGDQTLSIRVRNTSGADKSPSAGASWTVTIKTLAKYEKLG